MRHINQILNSIIVIVLLIAVGIFSYGFLKKKPQQVSQKIEKTDFSSLKEVNSDEIANKYLKEVQLKMKMEQLEAYKSIKIKNELNAIPKSVKNDDFSQIPADQQITKDHVLPRNVSGQISNIPTQLNAENVNDFIKAAKDSGYDVQINDKFEVISITPRQSQKSIRPDFDSHESEQFE